jgi:uncharacterized protein (TIGR02145 family)
MKKINLISVCLTITLFIPYTAFAQVRDIDSNLYQTVTIGKQVWMSENLKTTKCNDGTPIPLITDNATWGKLTTPGYCWYSNDDKNKNSYGALYNGYAVSTGKLCPSGWHVPSDSEWTILINFLGGEKIAGGKMKEKGTTHWKSPNSGATNDGGFTALPGGTRYTNGVFFTAKEIGYWWSASENNKLNAWYRSMYFKDSAVKRNYYDFTNGFSVRCIKD